MDASTSRRFRDNLTFSSSLLDQIYRSIDQQSIPSTRKKHTNFVGNRCCFEHHDDEQRACLYQKCKENKACETPVIGRTSCTADLEQSSMKCKRESFCFNSNPDFTCREGGGCGVSSSVYGVPVKPKLKLKPIRTSVYQHDELIKKRTVYADDDSRGTDKHEGRFMNTKSKALKIYSDLMKMKQPISPGGRLTTFLNSLFTTGNNKKRNKSTGDHTAAAFDRKSNSVNASTCSSASSFSRSCLTNTTSSRGKFSNEIKRSVNVDDETDSNRNRFTENLISESGKLSLSDENNHISEAARSLLKEYKKRVECKFDSVANVDEENDINDEKSDSSSDLFELNNLSPIRIHGHEEELPLYATTRVHTNRAIGNNISSSVCLKFDVYSLS